MELLGECGTSPTLIMLSSCLYHISSPHYGNDRSNVSRTYVVMEYGTTVIHPKGSRRLGLSRVEAIAKTQQVDHSNVLWRCVVVVCKCAYRRASAESPHIKYSNNIDKCVELCWSFSHTTNTSKSCTSNSSVYSQAMYLLPAREPVMFISCLKEVTYWRPYAEYWEDNILHTYSGRGDFQSFHFWL